MPGVTEVNLLINGQSHQLRLQPWVSLLDALRENAELTGTKKGCDHGQCGACTVIVDGKRINSCLSLAAQNQNKSITTIEGLEKNGKLHPMQQAFVDNDALQCGFCTPGQILSAVALLKEPCGNSEDDVRECMSGNICRCGTYRNILAAIQHVRSKTASTIKNGEHDATLSV
jgi:xanthine dehydrogenase YagT iron-sulfur-binding subunit